MNLIVRVLTLSLGISTALVLYNHLSEVALTFRFVLVGVVLTQGFIKKDEVDISASLGIDPSKWDWKSLWQKLRSFMSKFESQSTQYREPVQSQEETEPDFSEPSLVPAQLQSAQEAAVKIDPSAAQLQANFSEPNSVVETRMAALVEGLSSTNWRKLCNQLDLSGSKIPRNNRAEFLLKADVTIEQLQQVYEHL